MSDPCTLDIDGVVIGATSTDILFHMGAEEISKYAANCGLPPMLTPLEQLNLILLKLIRIV